MATAANVNLSRNDAAVLGALFDPEASLRNHARIDLKLSGPYDALTLSKIKTNEKYALLSINVDQPTESDVRQTISGLDEIISAFPNYASAWNNRAQARRMLHDLERANNDNSGMLLGCFSDLAKAIALASPKNANGMTSPENAQVLASAHTHRGYLLWSASRPDSPSNMLDGVDNMCGLTKDRLEEFASREFSLGGKYGNQTAQQLAVKTNPYAKLCGSIVREALQKEIKDFYEATR